MDLNHARQIGERQQQFFDTHGRYPKDCISFEFDGVAIINPFTDTEARSEVDPVAFYGEAFLNSAFVKP